MANQTENNQPDYLVFNVKEYGNDESNWTRVGAAWYHKDEEGLSIEFDLLPLDGKLTLRKPKEDQVEEAA